MHLCVTLHEGRCLGLGTGSPDTSVLSPRGQAKRAPRAAFPSGCLAAQTKRWAEGISPGMDCQVRVLGFMQEGIQERAEVE